MSFVHGVLFLGFLYQILIQAIVYSGESNFYSLFMCKMHATDIFAMFYPANGSSPECHKNKTLMNKRWFMAGHDSKNPVYWASFGT